MWKSVLSGFLTTLSSLTTTLAALGGIIWTGVTYFDGKAFEEKVKSFEAQSRYREELLLACTEFSTAAANLMIIRDRDQLAAAADEFLKLYHGKITFLTGPNANQNILFDGVSFVWGLKNNIYFAKTREGYVDELNYAGQIGVAREMSKVPVFCKERLQTYWTFNTGSAFAFSLPWLNSTKVDD
jgi:hypothetical protein